MLTIRSVVQSNDDSDAKQRCFRLFRYTTFDFGQPSQIPCGPSAATDNATLCLALPLTNNGTMSGSTVPQLYLQFPPVAHHPTALLKGFNKTKVLAPGEQTVATFRLTGRDLSWWGPNAAGSTGWVRGTAGLTAWFAASSCDRRRALVLTP